MLNFRLNVRMTLSFTVLNQNDIKSPIVDIMTFLPGFNFIHFYLNFIFIIQNFKKRLQRSKQQAQKINISFKSKVFKIRIKNKTYNDGFRYVQFLSVILLLSGVFSRFFFILSPCQEPVSPCSYLDSPEAKTVATSVNKAGQLPI